MQQSKSKNTFFLYFYEISLFALSLCYGFHNKYNLIISIFIE